MVLAGEDGLGDKFRLETLRRLQHSKFGHHPVAFNANLKRTSPRSGHGLLAPRWASGLEAEGGGGGRDGLGQAGRGGFLLRLLQGELPTGLTRP